MTEDLVEIARMQIRTCGTVSEGTNRMMMSRIRLLEKRLAYKEGLIQQQKAYEAELEEKINDLEDQS